MYRLAVLEGCTLFLTTDAMLNFSETNIYYLEEVSRENKFSYFERKVCRLEN